jgi:hypothetical protein
LVLSKNLQSRKTKDTPAFLVRPSRLFHGHLHFAQCQCIIMHHAFIKASGAPGMWQVWFLPLDYIIKAPVMSNDCLMPKCSA